MVSGTSAGLGGSDAALLQSCVQLHKHSSVEVSSSSSAAQRTVTTACFVDRKVVSTCLSIRGLTAALHLLMKGAQGLHLLPISARRYTLLSLCGLWFT